MNLERVPIDEAAAPFPIYDDPVASLLAAHDGAPGGRDATVAHLAGVLSAYAYADTATVAMMASRLGLGGGACVRIEQAIDAMFVFSTAYLVQSRCGRVVVLAYRGTEPNNFAQWLGDADVGAESIALGGEPLAVHAGFRRNTRATRFAVLGELERALAGRSLLDPERAVEHRLAALYVTGHSLGGAMALLFALSLADTQGQPALVALRAVYTFGQPLATGEPVPERGQWPVDRLFRHVLPRDPIPALPLAAWGRLAHFGREYLYTGGEWRESANPIAQLESARAIPRSLFALFASAERRAAARYSIAEHQPHHYLAALRPEGRVTELGDRG